MMQERVLTLIEKIALYGELGAILTLYGDGDGDGTNAKARRGSAGFGK
jgi:hypothetical protein